MNDALCTTLARLPQRLFLTGVMGLAFMGVGAAQDEPLFIQLPVGRLPSDVSDSGFMVVGSLLGGGTDPQFGNQGFYCASQIQSRPRGRRICRCFCDPFGFCRGAVGQFEIGGGIL